MDEQNPLNYRFFLLLFLMKEKEEQR